MAGIGNAIVIGAGIGGLAVATALARRGVVVTVLEQAPEITEVGAGIQVSPNGLAVLRALGLEAGLDRMAAVQAQAVVLAEHAKGREVARLDLRRLGGQRYLFVHRADLIALLAQAARQANVTVRTGTLVRKVVPGGLPEVHLADGTAERAELVIGADGVHSVARAAFGPPERSFFTGQVAWRTLVPAAGGTAPEVRVTMGPGRHLVSYPLRGGKLLNIVAVEEREEWTAEGWHHSDDPDHLRRAFEGFGGPVPALLEQAKSASLWGLFRHPVEKVWHRGGVALMGDAAHPTLPFLAQGANLALEDAWVLAEAAAGGRLDGYGAARRPRVAKVIKAAEGNAWKYHLRPGPKRWAAHAALRLGSRLAPGLILRQYDWIYRKDVTKG